MELKPQRLLLMAATVLASALTVAVYILAFHLATKGA